MNTQFRINGNTVDLIKAGKVELQVPYQIYADGSMVVGNKLFGPPHDTNIPMEHGDGSGGGGGGAGQSKKRTRNDGHHVSEPIGERISIGTSVPRSVPLLSNSRGFLGEIANREKNAMGLAWKQVKNVDGEMVRKLELVAYESHGGGKKKKADGKKKKKGKGGQQKQDDFGDDGPKGRKSGKRPKVKLYRD